jgi:cytochrome P450
MKHVPVVREFLLLFMKNYLEDSVGYFEILQGRYGDIFSKKLKGTPFYFLCSPSHAEHVLSRNQENYRKYPVFVNSFAPFLGSNNLVASNDIAQWKRDRELCKTAFEAELYFEDYSSRINRNLNRTMDDWQKQYASRGTPCPVGRDFDRLALENINQTIFHNLDVDADALAAHIPKAFHFLAKKMTSVTGLPWLLPSRRRRSYDAEAEFMGQVKRRALLSRLAQKKDYDDLLGNLLADYEVRDETSAEFQLVANQMLTFDVVGYTTTTSAMRWILAILALNPEVQEKVASEARAVCDGREPVYEDIQKLEYTRAAVMETLRLNPPLAYIVREVIADDEVDGYYLPARGCLMLNTYLIHRHPDYWSNRGIFDPERFLAEPYGQDYQYAYIPFGGGKRACIGKNFALLELTAATAMLARRFQFTLPAGFELRRQYVATVFVRPNLEYVMLKERR